MNFILSGSYKLRLFIIGFIIALALALIFNTKVVIGGLVLGLLLILFKRKMIWCLFLFGYLIGWGRVMLLPTPTILATGKYQFSATICREPDVRLTEQKLVLCGQLGKVLATTALYPPYHYGDQVFFSGVIKMPGEIDGFRYDRYLAKQDIYLVSYQPTIKKLVDNQFSFWSWLLAGKEYLKQLLAQGLREPEAGLGQALILGYQNTVDRQYMDLFSIIGVSHIIAISGTHITILAAIWQRVLSLFFRKPKFWLTAVWLSLYVFITGAAAAALRSLVMGLLTLIIMERGTKLDGEWLLVLSAGVLLLINPLLLTADLGFQLSYLSMIALIYFYPWLLGYFSNWRLPKWGKTILEILVLTLACQLLTAPIGAVNFGRLSIIAPLANVVLLWVFPYLMSTLLAGLVLGVILPKLALLIFFPAYLGLTYLLRMTKLLAAIPGAAIGWPLTWGGVAIYYLLLFLVFYYFSRLQKNRA